MPRRERNRSENQIKRRNSSHTRKGITRQITRWSRERNPLPISTETACQRQRLVPRTLPFCLFPILFHFPPDALACPSKPCPPTDHASQSIRTAQSAAPAGCSRREVVPGKPPSHDCCSASGLGDTDSCQRSDPAICEDDNLPLD